MFPGLLTEGAKNTLIFTIFSFLGGLVVGLVVALGRIGRTRWLRWPAAIYTDVMRGLPALLTIVFIGYGIPIATGWQFPWPKYFPGCLALSLVGGAYIAETIRAGIESVPRGQMEAARSLGMKRRVAMRRVILPQAFRLIIPPLTNELVLLFKDSSLVLFLGVQLGERELTKFGRDLASTKANITPILVAGLCYLVITVPLSYLARRLEARNAKASA
jgi:polar amino acid transport system permease protein